MTQNIYRLDPACYLLSLTTIQSSLKSLRDLLGEEVVDKVDRVGRVELMAKEMDYSYVKMMLLIMSGLEKNPGPGRTNKETLEFMKNLSSDIYSESNLESAKKFFNGFISDRKMLGTWREKFLMEHKSVRQKFKDS